jgi:hypothetical protein
MFGVLLQVIGLFSLGSVVSLSVGAKTAHARPVRIERVLAILENTSTGHKILERARKQWGLRSGLDEIQKYIRWSNVSKTDAVLVRTFDSETGVEKRERRVTVLLRQNQSELEVILDLAHEMTHATDTPAWDPYDPDLTVGSYVSQAIEGPGGEAAALENECRVARELHAKGPAQERCAPYWLPGNGVDRAKIVADFYRVGHERNKVIERFGDGRDERVRSQISADRPILFSSTGRAPYPVALIAEYTDITTAACRNTLRRVELAGGKLRSPASVTGQPTTLRFIAKRCAELLGSR